MWEYYEGDRYAEESAKLIYMEDWEAEELEEEERERETRYRKANAILQDIENMSNEETPQYWRAYELVDCYDGSADDFAELIKELETLYNQITE